MNGSVTELLLELNLYRAKANARMTLLQCHTNRSFRSKQLTEQYIRAVDNLLTADTEVIQENDTSSK